MGDLSLKSGNTGRSVFFSTFFSLIAKLFSFVQAMVVSYFFGANKSTDFLFFCVSITLLLPGLFNNINQSVIVPNAIAIREKKSEGESRKFVSYIYFLYIVVGIAACTVISLIPEEFMVLVSKFGRDDIRENLRIVQLVIPTFFFTVTSSFLLDVFNSYKYFTLPMILDMFKSILTILFIVLFGKRYGVVSMAAGILIAQIVQFLLLNAFLVRLFGLRLGLGLRSGRYPIEKKLQKNIFYVVVSQLSTILSQYVAIYLISGLEEGVYTALSYSDRLNSIFVLVFAGQVTTVFGINIIEMYAREQYEKLNQQYQKYLKVTLTVILPFCFILAVQAPMVISVLFERGNFTAESVRLTSIFFQYTILIVPLLLMDRMIVRLIIAKQIMRISFLWNVISKILTCAVVFLIVQYIDFRYYGLGLLLVQLVYIVLINLFMIRKQFSFIRIGSCLSYLAVSSVLCAAVCYGVYWILPRPAPGGLLEKMGFLCAYSALVMAGYYLAGYLTYNRETILQLVMHLRQLIPQRSGSRTARIRMLQK